MDDRPNRLINGYDCLADRSLSFLFSFSFPYSSSPLFLSHRRSFSCPSTFPLVFSASSAGLIANHQTRKLDERQRRRFVALKVSDRCRPREGGVSRGGRKILEILSRSVERDWERDVSGRSWMEVGAKTNRDLYGTLLLGQTDSSSRKL